MYYNVFFLGLIACLTIIRVPPASSISCYQCNTAEDCRVNRDNKVVDCPNSKGCFASFKSGVLDMRDCAQSGTEYQREECLPDQGSDKCYCVGDKCNDGYLRCYRCGIQECGGGLEDRTWVRCHTDTKNCLTRFIGGAVTKDCAPPSEEYKENGCVSVREPNQAKAVEHCFCRGSKCNVGLGRPVVVVDPVKKCYVCRRPCAKPSTTTEVCTGAGAWACITVIGTHLGKEQVISQYCGRPEQKKGRAAGFAGQGCSIGPDGDNECACKGELCNSKLRSSEYAVKMETTTSNPGITLQIGRIAMLPTLWMMGRAFL